ncbi:MAG: FixH family protein, partial [Ignavibacteriaceae bacterium]|nr:FixH family protein [Ignavibacteriaceae bacterium]
MKAKLNWGTGILIGIIVFVIISITMTVIFMTQDVSLVSDNYYEKSLSYQDEIDKQSRTKSLDEQVKINFNEEVITISVPSNYLNKDISGEIFFYRPSNPKLDFVLPLQLVEGNQIIPVERLEKGFWRLKLNWTMDGNGYYNERAITVE